ncbi:MAG: helix-turn-helix domain-containing protein, partial [Pseudonocardiaceae bacterium]
ATRSRSKSLESRMPRNGQVRFGGRPRGKGPAQTGTSPRGPPNDSMVAALATYDFATVFRRVRAATGWSQQTLGNLIGLGQGRVSAIERNARRLRDIAVIARVATFLCIPPILLGFGDLGTTVGEAGIDGPKAVDWVERRNFVEHVATLTVGVTAVARL